MTHLNPDELVDAIEQPLPADRQAHLAGCAQCQGELAALSNVLGEAKQAAVPEPSPFFWTHFSEGVRSAIDQDADQGRHWPSWLRWQVLLPLGATAMIVLALMMSVPKPEPSAADDVALAADATEAPQALDSWVMLAALVGELDLDTAVAAGVVLKPGLADQAVMQLTTEEQQELTRLLKAELTRAKS